MQSLKFQLDKLQGNVKPEVLMDEGFLVVPFDIINSTSQDMLRMYVKPFLAPSAFKKLMGIVASASKGTTVLNVFTSSQYKRFLQMISKEDYVENRTRYKTVAFDVLYSESDVDIDRLPVLRNSGAGRKIFNVIVKSSYGNFKPDDLHFIRVSTSCLELGIKMTLCEYNVYIPDKYFSGGTSNELL